MSLESDEHAQRWFGSPPPRFNPDEGEVVAEPPGSGYGYWAGAPSAAYDPASRKFYLYYRLRWPLGGRRGGTARIAESPDGSRFETIWSVEREELKANSIEGASILQTPRGLWRLYISFEVREAYDRCPPTWRVSVIEAKHPSQFAAPDERPVLDGPMFGFPFIKDPAVYLIGGQTCAFCQVAEAVQHVGPDAEGVRRPAGRAAGALFTSADGLRFTEGRIVFAPEGGGRWDGFARRFTSILYSPPVFYGFYDGAAGRADSYDEFCGLARSLDLIHWTPLCLDGPWARSSHASGSVRYLEALRVGSTIHYYYEYARSDRAHELRHFAAAL